MQTRATVKIKIPVCFEIVKTIKIYKKALQFCIDFAWDNKIKNKIKLQYAIYSKLKKTGLQAQLIICCCRQAIEMCKKAKSKPIVKRCSIRYNFPRSASLKNKVLSISTIKGRVKIPFVVPEIYKEYFLWDIKESLLRIDKKSRCFFLFNFAKDIDVAVSRLQTRVLGIDVGINNVAVTSDEKFFGKNIKSKRIKHDKLVSKLQAKGTKSAKRLLRKISGRWTRFMAWTNHNISKRIVNSIEKGDVVVQENLLNIRKGKTKRNRWVHKWAFRQLQSFIEYKTTKKGCRVVYINPAYTSKECSVCHNILIRHRGFVSCPHCGFSLSADLNASRNIAKRYMRNFCSVDVTQPYSSCDDSKAIFSGTADEHRAKSPPALAVG